MDDPARDDDAQQMRDTFAEFERAVLQDNIILCDQKAGILLAFAAAMILVCLQAFADPSVRQGASPVAFAIAAGFLAGAAAFLVSCVYALATVVPRIRKGRDDHIFWESAVFKLPVEEYVVRFREMDTEAERDNRLRYLHSLAAICRAKFRHFAQAMRFGQVGFVILVITEAAKAFS